MPIIEEYMKENTKKSPSPAQREQFISVAGYPYPENTTEGTFKTDRPHNDGEWKLSPFWVQYIFQEEDGKLFCELSHRMTNNRGYGWDYDGNPLPSEEVEAVYPSYF